MADPADTLPPRTIYDALTGNAMSLGDALPNYGEEFTREHYNDAQKALAQAVAEVRDQERTRAAALRNTLTARSVQVHRDGRHHELGRHLLDWAECPDSPCANDRKALADPDAAVASPEAWVPLSHRAQAFLAALVLHEPCRAAAELLLPNILAEQRRLGAEQVLDRLPEALLDIWPDWPDEAGSRPVALSEARAAVEQVRAALLSPAATPDPEGET